MADPFSMALGAVTLAGIAHKFSRQICSLIDGIQAAPATIQAVSADLKAFYAVLGTLESLLRNEWVAQNPLMRNVALNLDEVLTNCVRIFREFGVIVNKYVEDRAEGTSRRGGILRGASWVAVEREIGSLREHLAACKATCSMAVNTAIYVRSIEANDIALRMTEDVMSNSLQTQQTLGFILRRLDDIESTRVRTPSQPLPTPSHPLSHETLPRYAEGQDNSAYSFCMQRFLAETSSVLPKETPRPSFASSRPSSPSIVVSDGGASSMAPNRWSFHGDERRSVSDGQSLDGSRPVNLGSRERDVGLRWHIRRIPPAQALARPEFKKSRTMGDAPRAIVQAPIGKIRHFVKAAPLKISAPLRISTPLKMSSPLKISSPTNPVHVAHVSYDDAGEIQGWGVEIRQYAAGTLISA